MAERELLVQTNDGSMKAFVVYPDSDGPFPVALLFMDGVGYREQIKANARRFAAAGYYCVAPDLYYRSGEGVNLDMSSIATLGMDSPEVKRMMAIVSSVTPVLAEADTRALLSEIASDPSADAGPKVCVGYCMGARIALHIAAVRDDVVAAAAIHPGALITNQPDSPHLELKHVKGELYFAFAGIDHSVTSELVDQFRFEMEIAGVRGLVERLDGAAHGFAMADLVAYDHDASERHFAKTLDLWSRNLMVTSGGH